MDPMAFRYDYVCVPPQKQIGKDSHPQWELSYVLLGSGTRTIGELTEPMEEGEIILVPPDMPHQWHFSSSHTDAEGNISNISVFFYPATLEGLAAVLPEFTGVADKIKSLAGAVSYAGQSRQRIAELLLSMRGLAPERRLPAMLELLRELSHTEACREAGRNKTMTRLARRLEKVRIYCRCNYARTIELDEMAACVGMNKSAFCTFMRRHMGCTLSAYVNDIRLERAMEMLCCSDKTVAAVAYDAGFSNVSYFNRLFRARYGHTPTAARRRSK